MARWPFCPHCGNADGERIYKLTANHAKKIRLGLYKWRVAHASGGGWVSKLNLRVPHPLRFAAKSGRFQSLPRWPRLAYRPILSHRRADRP